MQRPDIEAIKARCEIPHKDLPFLEHMRSLVEECQDIPALLAYIEELEAQNRWVPVAERLPEEDICVLVYMPNGIDAFGVSFLYRGRWQEIGLGHEDVTHWRELPQPPKDGE